VLGLGGDQRERGVHRAELRRARAVQVDDLGQQRDEAARGRVVEAHGAADRPDLARQRIPSSLRSNTHSGPAGRSAVSRAFIGATKPGRTSVGGIPARR
jgi:hypothetical protein